MRAAMYVYPSTVTSKTALFTFLAVGLLTAESPLADHVASSVVDEDRKDPRNDVPIGHLKPLGSHRPSEGSIDEVEGFLNPSNFYRDYVLASKPVLFKGAAHDLPAYQRWSDIYLNEKYGRLSVEVEKGKKEDRSGNMVQMTMSDFLRIYNESDIYMVQDVHLEMRDDLILPKSVQCGGYQNTLSTTVIWFSSGGTKSVLHYDDLDNINCILDGTKDVVMIDKERFASNSDPIRDCYYWAFRVVFGGYVVCEMDVQEYDTLIEDTGFNYEKGYSFVDVEKADLLKFPKIRDIPWWEAHMKKGDCLFIPLRWYHTVASSNSRNLAVNLWFVHLAWFNESDCADCCKTNDALSNYNIGNSPEQILHHVFSSFEGRETIQVADALQAWEEDLRPESIHELFSLIDTNKDSSLSWEEMFQVDSQTLLHDFPELFGQEAEAEIMHDEL